MSFCFFEHMTHSFFVETIQQNKHNKELDKKLGKKVFSFIQGLNGAVTDKWFYTSELSRILLVGEPKIFESIRWYPIIDAFCIMGPLFDNRFDAFVKNVKQYSQQELEEAIQDALLLFQYSSKGYTPNKLLDHLIEDLQNTIKHIEHNYVWDQKSCSSLKKSASWLVGLIAVIAITNRYAVHNNKITSKAVALESCNNLATLSCIPLSYKLLQDSYNVLTIDPHVDNQYLHRYEALLLFVQRLKLELSTNGCITFKLASGCVATINDNQLTFQ